MTTIERPVSGEAVTPLRPLPITDPATQFFWEATKMAKLCLLRCQNCGKYNHWPRPICRFCLSEDLAPDELSGRGTVWSFTTVIYPYHPGMPPPYVLAAIELVEQPGLRLVSNIVGCPESELVVGMGVEVVFEKITEDITLPLFRRHS